MNLVPLIQTISKRTIVLSLILLPTLSMGNSTQTKNNATKDTKLTFDSTQSWGTHEKHFLETWKSKYVPKEMFESVAKAMTPPPALGSKEAAEEASYLLALQNLRSEKSENIIVREMHVCGFHIGNYRLGLNPKLDNLVLEAYFDSRLWGFMGKHRWNRVRPSFIISELKPNIANPPHPAFPSNHTFQALVVANVLSQLWPENANAYLQDALEIGRNRELAGVHYPSDTRASIILAHHFGKVLAKNKAFKKALAQIDKTKFSPRVPGDRDNKDVAKCMDYALEWANKRGVFKK